MGAEWAACQSRRTEFNHSNDERCKVCRGQPVGRDKCTTEHDTCYKSENGSAIRSGCVVGDLSWKEKEARDHNVEEGGSSNEMGFSIHTPVKTPTPQGSNPQINKTATATSWKVYPRTRRYQKQVKEGCAKSEA